MHLAAVTNVDVGYTAVEDAPGSVVIGLGDPNLRRAGQSVILNYKGYALESFASVSQFVASASGELWSLWKERIATSADVTTLVVEDYSLDTCFGWLLFRARLEGGPVSGATGFDEAAWVAYVTAWEEGEFVDVAVETSPACLVTELGNALLPGPRSDAKPGLTLCLQYLQEILDACPSPPVGGLPSSFSSSLHRQAVALIGFDRQQFDAAMRRGKTFQLLLPSAVSVPTAAGVESEPGRLMIVDAIATQETEPTAILKTILRTDRENSWTRRGFAVWAVYRPSQALTGNDMTVSVDPSTHLDLQALWTRLEELEDREWGNARPRDKPRRVQSYTDADGSLKPGAPNQPWWDDSGKYTLVGAPKEVAPGLDGTRLSWNADVLPALWELYFLRHVRAWVKFTEYQESAGKHVHRAEWQPSSTATDAGSDSYQLLPDAPSFHAWLAACSMHREPLAVRDPMELPNAEAFERIPNVGGYAVVTREGVSLFGATPSSVPANLLAVAKGMSRAVEAYSDFLRHHSANLAALAEQLQGGDGTGVNPGNNGTKRSKGTTWNVEAWERELSVPRAEVLRADVQLATLPPDFDSERLRKSLATMWGLHEQRDEVRVAMDRLDQLMRQSIARRTERRERIYGSLLSAAALALALGQLTGPVGELMHLTPDGLLGFELFWRVVGVVGGLVLFLRLGIRGR